MRINLSAWSDRLNPVLVKEVRQATRSRSFTLVLLAALGIASFLSAGFLIDAASRGQRPSGEGMLMSLAAIYTWLIRIYVILSAFQATAEEYSEDTIDQLLLSSLSPWRIAIGKFQASVVLIFLLLSSFLPFAAVTFLMDGVGLERLIASFARPTIDGLSFVALAVLAGALARNKGLRILLVSVLIFAVFVGGARAMVMTRMLSPGGMLSAGLFPILGISALQAVGHVVLLIGFASAAMTPKGEDRSSIPRRAFTIWFVLQALCLVATVSLGGTASLAPASVGIRILFLQTLPFLALFLTEQHKLPRSAKPVPKGKPFRHLRNLWLPGGDRAVGYLVVHVAAFTLFVLALTMGGVLGTDRWLQATFSYAMVVAGWIVLPVTLMSSWTQKPRGRIFTLALLVVLWVLAPVASSIIGFMLGQGSDMRSDDNMNPFRLLTNTSSNPDIWDYRVTIVLASIAIALQLMLLLRRLSKSRA